MNVYLIADELTDISLINQLKSFLTDYDIIILESLLDSNNEEIKLDAVFILTDFLVHSDDYQKILQCLKSKITVFKATNNLDFHIITEIISNNEFKFFPVYYTFIYEPYKINLMDYFPINLNKDDIKFEIIY